MKQVVIRIFVEADAVLPINLNDETNTLADIRAVTYKLEDELPFGAVQFIALSVEP